VKNKTVKAFEAPVVEVPELENETVSQARRLIALQNQDGSWSWTPEVKSLVLHVQAHLVRFPLDDNINTQSGLVQQVSATRGSMSAVASFRLILESREFGGNEQNKRYLKHEREKIVNWMNQSLERGERWIKDRVGQV
jgi:hypothetical protein